MSTLESLARSGGGASERIVWEAVYAYTAIHRAGGIENDDYITHKSREQMVVHLIAPTYALAKALLDLKYIRSQCTLVSLDPVCTINDEMDLTRGGRA
jgi:hypothetical protein